MKDLAGLGEPAPAPFLLRMSCADLAPEALSVRLGFLTKHNIPDLFLIYIYIYTSQGIQRHVYIIIAVKSKNAKI